MFVNLLNTKKLICASLVLWSAFALGQYQSSSPQITYESEVESWLNDASSNQAASANSAIKSIIDGSSLKADAVSRDAFNSVRQSLNPLTPEQIKTLKRDFDTAERAKAFEGDAPQRLVSRVVQVDLNPGASTPVVRLGANMVSSVLFLDSTGQPWPIVDYDIENPGAFDIRWQSKDSMEDARSNTLMIQPLQHYGRGNLAVMLQGLNVPVVVNPMPGQKVADYRADIQVPEHGPNAVNTHDGLPSYASGHLVSFLNAVPPSIAEALEVEGESPVI